MKMKTKTKIESPPHEEGWVAAPSRKCREATESAQTGWSLWRPSCFRRSMGQRRSGTYNTRSKKNFRKELRNSLTAAEAVLWQNLKGRQLLGKKFRRQIGIGRYIVDFYCPEAGLVIELDGDRHFSITIDEYEARRTKYLEEEGLRISDLRTRNCTTI